jgi:hypothetical protein
MIYIMKKKNQNMWENLYVVAIRFATKKQLEKIQPICFVFKSHVTNYIKAYYFMFSHENTHVILGWAQKTLTLKEKHKFLEKICN